MPKSTDELQQLALTYAKARKFDSEAQEINSELTKRTPADVGAWTRLARCHLEMGQIDSAEEALQQAVRRNPQNTIARSLRDEVATRRAAIADRVNGQPTASIKACFQRRDFRLLGRASQDR